MRKNYGRFPRVGQGFWTEVKTQEHHLRLFSAVTEIGEVGCVFDMDAKAWISGEWANDLEHGKRKAEAVARAVLKIVPSLEWKGSL
jgi:hypothetical protein